MSFFTHFRRHARGAATLAPARPAVANGIRGAIATVAPLVAAHFLGITEPGLMGLAGFGTAIVDKGGAYRARATAMTAFAFLGSLSALVGVAAAQSKTSAITVSFFWIALCAFIRVYGAAAASVGSMSAVVYIVSLSSGGAMGDGVERAGLVLAGCAWAMLLALVLWPIRFYRPARLAVANCYRSIGTYAREIAAAGSDAEEWSRVFSRNHTRIHESLEQARAVLAATRRGRQGESGRGERLLVLLEEADRLMTSVIGIADALQADGHGGRNASMRAVLDEFRARAEAIADSVESETKLSDIEPLPIDHLMPEPFRHQAIDLQHHLTAAIAAANQMQVEAPHDAADKVLVGVATRRSPFEPLGANLNFDSVVLRHALRVGAAACIATILTTSLGLHRGYWVTISAVVVLQPYVDATFRKGLQRVAGAIAGGTIAAAVVAVVPHSGVLLGVIFVAAAMSLAVLPINYAVYATFTTPTFVLLAEMNAGDWHLVGVRILNTILGGAIAFVCARIFWPTPEQTLFPQRLAAALSANGRYLSAVFEYLAGDEATPPGVMRAARRASAIALLNLEASLQRLVGEHRGGIEPLMTLVVFNRRLSVALTALASRKAAVSSGREKAQRAARELGEALESVLSSAAGQGPLRPVPELDAPFDRIGEIVEVLQSAAARAFPRDAATGNPL